MSNVGKRVRSKCQGETEEMRNGTIISDEDGICLIKWDDEEVKGATFSSEVVRLIELYTSNSPTHPKTLRPKPDKPHFTVLIDAYSPSA